MTKNPGYIIYIVFYRGNGDFDREIEYDTETDHKKAILDMWECLDGGGYCVVTRWNESEIIKTKSQLWEFKF